MKKKVLLVDDEPDFVRMLKIRLEANNYHVTTAENGHEALKKLKQDKPDVVLLDILMPKLDGLQTLRKIRRYDKRLPIFIITAFSNQERFELANNLDASGFIVKTSDLKSEIEHISTALKMSAKYKNS